MPLDSRPIRLILYRCRETEEVHRIWINQQSTYGDVSKEFATMNPPQNVMVLRPIWCPRPHWIEAEPHSPIESKCQVIYSLARDDSIRCILGVVRTVSLDYPIPIFEPMHGSSLTVSQAIIEQYPELARRIQSITSYSNDLDMMDAQCSYKALNQYQPAASPVIWITLEDPPEDFLDDLSDVSIPGSLQVPLAYCKRLLQRAYDLDSFSLQIIHLSGGLLHLIVSLAMKMERLFEIDAPEIDTFLKAEDEFSDFVHLAPILVREMERLLDATSRVMDGIELGDFHHQEIQQTLESLFDSLCEEFPGAVTIRNSYTTFKKLARTDYEDAMLGTNQTQGTHSELAHAGDSERHLWDTSHLAPASQYVPHESSGYTQLAQPTHVDAIPAILQRQQLEDNMYTPDPQARYYHSPDSYPPASPRLSIRSSPLYHRFANPKFTVTPFATVDDIVKLNHVSYLPPQSHRLQSPLAAVSDISEPPERHSPTLESRRVPGQRVDVDGKTLENSFRGNDDQSRVRRQLLDDIQRQSWLQLNQDEPNLDAHVHRDILKHGLGMVGRSVYTVFLVEDKDSNQWRCLFGSEEVSCKKVDKRFERVERAIEHVRSHLGHRPFACDGTCHKAKSSGINCGKRFFAAGYLEDHKKRPQKRANGS